MNAKQRRAKDRKPSVRKTIDSYQNFGARVGLGTDNQATGYNYQADYLSRNRLQLENMYRSSWICGVAVDCVAEDMTKAGIQINSVLEPDEIEDIQAEMERMDIWGSLCDVIKWGRLYGGGVGIILIEGDESRLEQALRPEAVRPDSFKGIYALDRWQVIPVMSELITEYGSDIGKPKFYDIVTDCMAIPRGRIHYSRLIRIDGQALPYQQRIAENGWGQSILERLLDRLVAFDSTTDGAAQLVFRAHLRVMKINRLREIIATGGQMLTGLNNSMDMIRHMQSNEGLTLIDGEDEMQFHTYGFSGLDSILLQFGQQISGAIQVPLVRLFGQSPNGLSATGESDWHNYHDGIYRQQESKLRQHLLKIITLICASSLNIPMPGKLAITFNSLKKVDDAAKAGIAEVVGRTVSQALADGTISPAVAMKELRQSSSITGIFTNITDEDISQAENDPPPLPDMAPSDDQRPVRDSSVWRRLIGRAVT